MAGGASIWRRRSFSLPLLAAAVRDTFERRRTELPTELPTALTPTFGARPVKMRQWQAFTERNRPMQLAALGEVVKDLARFLSPVLDAAWAEIPASMVWPPNGPWARQ
jgi:hypothetical protein